MSQDRTNEQQPSMEEILTSIRRIVDEGAEEGDPPAPAAAPSEAAAPGPAADAAEPPPAAEPLVSPATASASTGAFARLTRAMAAEAKPALGGKTVEELLAELLRPMLKEWLDRHLPQVVERVVEQEVKKLARRAELM
jgi:cell pole-organizing protein PopZ